MSKRNTLRQLAFEIFEQTELITGQSHLTTDVVRHLFKHIESKSNYTFDLNDIDGYDGELILSLFDIVFRVNDREQFIYTKQAKPELKDITVLKLVNNEVVDSMQVKAYTLAGWLAMWNDGEFFHVALGDDETYFYARKINISWLPYIQHMINNL